MCYTPLEILNKNTDRYVTIPCQKCLKCLRRRASGWSFRMMQQEKICDSAHFLTLTYDTTHVPITANGFMSLNRGQQGDLTLFFKRLRKAHEKAPNYDHSNYPIKYYAVGEYGGARKRPHYHAILFNAQLQLIQPAWRKGSVHYGKVEAASIGYCLKYMMKPPYKRQHGRDDRIKEFAVMSKGLGLNYLTDAAKRWHLAAPLERMYLNIEDGKKIAMPRYYKDKLYDQSLREEIAFYQLTDIRAKEEKLRNQYGWEELTKQRLETSNRAFKKMLDDHHKHVRNEL